MVDSNGVFFGTNRLNGQDKNRIGLKMFTFFVFYFHRNGARVTWCARCTVLSMRNTCLKINIHIRFAETLRKRRSSDRDRRLRREKDVPKQRTVRNVVTRCSVPSRVRFFQRFFQPLKRSLYERKMNVTFDFKKKKIKKIRSTAYPYFCRMRYDDDYYCYYWLIPLAAPKRLITIIQSGGDRAGRAGEKRETLTAPNKQQPVTNAIPVQRLKRSLGARRIIICFDWDGAARSPRECR